MTAPTFLAAFRAACSELTDPHPDQSVDMGSWVNRYVSLTELHKHVDKVLTPHGLARRYVAHDIAPGHVGIEALIFGDDGETVGSGVLCAGTGRGGPQDVKGATTYLRRTTLELVLGLATDHDDDAQRVQESVQHHSDRVAELARRLVAQRRVEEQHGGAFTDDFAAYLGEAGVTVKGRAPSAILGDRPDLVPYVESWLDERASRLAAAADVERERHGDDYG